MTFRHPGNFAKVVTTVDEMSGGRIEVGVGAGWNELEHRQLGLPFPPIEERADLLEDTLAILHGLWGEPDGWSYTGHQVSIDGASFHPKPVDVPGRPRTAIGGARPRILIGGGGTPRSFRLAARYADEFNLNTRSPDHTREAYAELDAACRAIGRDPGTLTRSAMVGVLVGRTEAEMASRVAAAVEAFGSDADDVAWLAERTTRWITGTPDEARAAIRRYEAAGVERIVLQDFLPWDLDMIDVMGEAPRSSRELIRRPGVDPRVAAPLVRSRTAGALAHGSGRASGSAPDGGRGPLRCQRRPGPGASAAGGLGGAEVGRVVAADRIGVRAAGAGQALGEELERRRRPDQGGHRAGRLGASGRAAGRRASGSGRRSVQVGGQDGGRPQADLARGGQRLTGARQPLARGAPGRPGSGPGRSRGRSPADARGGTSRGPGRPTAATTPPRP